MNESLDRRLNVYRPDLADIRFQGHLQAARFTAGEAARIVEPVVDLKAEPKADSGTQSQLLMGEGIRVFERRSGWCWIQADSDDYVGYIKESACEPGAITPTHRVVAPRTFLYPDADLRLPPVAALSAGSLLTVGDEAETRGTLYYRLSGGGAVVARHCLPIGEVSSMDYITIAEDFMETPYLWGGRSGFGIDCSGLVQLTLALAGLSAPRDSDMQAAGLGHEIDPGENQSALRRGDFVFWSGHVGMMEDSTTLIHASGHTMSVTRESLDEATARITSQYGAPTFYRRL